MASRDMLPVTITGNGIRHKITVDGHDVSNSTVRAELEIDPREGTVLRLHLVVHQRLGVDEHARVLLDAETENALKAMGWTPPADKPEHSPGCELRFAHAAPDECQPAATGVGM